MFSMSLVTLDSYQSTPLSELDVTFSDFRGTTIKQVPVIRVFGSTSTGIKTCLHVHGVFPYMYVPCTVDQNVDSFMYRLATSIDSAINVSLGRATSNNHHVYRIQKVSGIPIYGYHQKEHLFFKIYFYNPAMIKRAADLLQNGVVLNQSFQPHEAHIPFILQFMIDYNLYGMSLINLSNITHRQRTDAGSNENTSSLSDLQKYLPLSIVRQSTCKLEVDAVASDILNRQEILNGLELNPGIAAIWNDERARRDAKGLHHAESQFLYTNSCDRRVYLPTYNDCYQEERLVRRLQSISQIDESKLSPTKSTLSYPLEVENVDNSLDASDALSHLKLLPQNDVNQSNVIEFENSQRIEKTLIGSQSLETSVLDGEDMHLLKILENLAEASDEETIVDNDSVLASQCSALSNEIKDDNEDDEVEDLNITSLDLNSLSSWNSVSRLPSQSSVSETNTETRNVENNNGECATLEDNLGDGTVLNFPQNDGANDMPIIANSTFEKSVAIKLKGRRKIYHKTSGTCSNKFQSSNISLILNQFNYENFESCIKEFCNIITVADNNSDYALNIKQIPQKLYEYCFLQFNTIHITFSGSNIYNSIIRTKLYRQQAREFKTKRKKKAPIIKPVKRYVHYNDNMLSMYKFDHRDLDVFDIDKTECALLSTDYADLRCTVNPYVNVSDMTREFNTRIESLKNCSVKIRIPAMDGATGDSSSESEPDPDVTIDRQEKRICVYKSCTKSKQGSVVDTTPKKRKLHVEDCSLESPQKRRNIDSDTLQKGSYHTPKKSRLLQSPRCLSGKYSPLNVTVISPRMSKSTVQKCGHAEDEPSSSKLSGVSGCMTPKRMGDQLRISLLREQNSGLSPSRSHNIFDGKMGDVKESTIFAKSTSIQHVKGLGSTSTKNKSTNLDNESTNAASSKKHSISRTNKEVRKRLSFLNTDEREIDNLTGAFDEQHFENLPLAERIVNLSNEDNDPANIRMITTNNHNSTSFYEQTNAKIHVDTSLPGTSKQVMNWNTEDLENQTIKVNDDEVDHDDDDNACDMTFTQYINTKLETDAESSILIKEPCNHINNEILTITTKFNPPSRERIVNTMKLYDILECKSIGPFFSNKIDLLKQKESSNKNSVIPNLVPFKCSLDKVTGIKLWRRVKVNEFHPSGSSIKSCDIKRTLAGYNSVIIQPLIPPPSTKSIRSWVKAKEYLSKKNNTCKRTKNLLPVEDKEDNKANKSEGHCNKIREDTKESEIRPDPSTDRLEAPNANSSDFQRKVVQQSMAREPSFDIEEANYSKQHSQGSNNTEHSSRSNSSSLNPSLRNILENPLLYRNNETPEYLGISYGQIEYTMKEDSGNVTAENFQNAKALPGYQYLTLLSLELHVATRGELLPDPEHDSIEALFYAIHNDAPISSNAEQIEHGVIVANPVITNTKLKNIHTNSANCLISYVASEIDLLNSLVTLIRHCDPDILVGWEIESLSWGYVFQRASRVNFNNFMWEISRIPHVAPVSGGQTLDSKDINDVKVPGRIILDVWRIMRHEAALLNYTFGNVMYHVMRERIPCPTFKTLTDWWKHINIVVQWRVINHYVLRVLGTVRILMQLDIIGRTCEHAKLFGLQFYEVFSRGSQFRVESMMLRLAKPLNYIAVSPSVQQRAKMRAPQALPLIMEPQSLFYTDPMIVLDFQSLYPSIIIAHNYCFSTCVGRIEHIGQYEPFIFGATTLRIKKSTALKLQGKLNFSPCGVAYVNSEVRQGILPRMLTEILNTRLMVKESIKLHGNENRVLQRVLDSQQLGLKLIANVTYGYTAANFSGRMPCSEVADSVVSKGRETLERAIKVVESTPKWGAQVVYGDTDSLFVLVPGKTRAEAFKIGAEIADTVTAANPPPIKLKFEKILHPCILQTKKRYCGYMYEYPEQEQPEYLAKGIETVRRDGCPAVAKILEKSLKILFDTKDLSLIKLYVTRQFDKILRRKISIQDLTFAKEFRGLRGYKPSACVPALELTRRLMRKDPRAIPRTGERVRYVIVAGAPNQALIQCVRTPMEVISDEGLNPNSIYYITKVVIPPLNRCLNLIGIDVNTWYREMYHRQTPDKAVSLFTDNQKSTIRQFFSTVVCVTCGEQGKKDICMNCMSQPNQTVTILQEKLRCLERTYHQLNTICQSCTGCLDDPRCESLDCPVLYRFAQARRDLIQIPYLNSIINGNDSATVEGEILRQ